MSERSDRPGGAGRVAYVQCAAGVAGDMLLAALVDAGASMDAVHRSLAALGVDGYTLTFERVQRGGIAATLADVAVERREHEHRPVRAIRQLLDASALEPAVRDTARSVFDALAVAEGAVHGIDPDDVELHEVGALDSIVDVVGVSAALHALGIAELVAGPVAVGRGTIQAAHGQLPNPPPAVAYLLAQRSVPTIGIDTDMELSTPTGVAVLTACCDRFGAMPAMTVESVGYGAGRADPRGRPNVVQLIVGRAVDPDPVLDGPGRPAVLVETNVDDVTGEVIAHAIARLLSVGAHDAWATPIVMKKGRPAFLLSAVCDRALAEPVAATMLAETGSLGVRATSLARWPQARTAGVVEIGGHRIGVKVAAGRVKVEHDDAVAAAEALGRPLREVLRLAEERFGEGDEPS